MPVADILTLPEKEMPSAFSLDSAREIVDREVSAGGESEASPGEEIREYYSNWRGADAPVYGRPTPEGILARNLSQCELGEIEVLGNCGDVSTNHELDKEAVTNLIKRVLDPTNKENRDIINSLVDWAAKDGNDHIGFIEYTLSKLLDNDGLTLSVLTLLGEIQPYRANMFIVEDLAEWGELKGNLGNSVVAQLRVINRLNERHANRIARKIWNFVRDYIKVVQDHTDYNLDRRFGGGYRVDRSTLGRDFFHLACQEIPYARNYLVSKLLQEVRDTQMHHDSRKEGALLGVGGG